MLSEPKAKRDKFIALQKKRPTDCRFRVLDLKFPPLGILDYSILLRMEYFHPQTKQFYLINLT